MPRYYFDIDNGTHSTKDEEGVELDGKLAVRDAAIAALPSIARDVMPNHDDHVIICTVRNEAGQEIFKAHLTLSATWIDEP